MKKAASRKRPTYALVFRFHDPAELQYMHGHRISEVVHDDITRRFACIARRVLSRHAPLCEPFTPQFGVWVAPFRMKTWAVGFDVEDQISAMTETGVELAREMLDVELGRASAMHVEFRFGVLCEPSGTPSRGRSGSAGRPHPRVQRRRGRARRLPGGLRDILRRGLLDFHLQPIVSLHDLKPVGFEALVRGPAGGPVERADRIFAAAAYHGLHRELELACVAGAWKQAAACPTPIGSRSTSGPTSSTRPP